ncbi:MAG: MYXO-CTERM domain-containing protein [Myxococcota bacterium]|jgi:MYXO-CTERM domain-containing protein
MMFWVGLAAAESFNLESDTVVLSRHTILFVEILGSAELLNWEGEGGIDLLGPGGATGRLEEGGSFQPSSLGFWQLTLDEDQPPGWDITVSTTYNGYDGGRLFSYLWRLSSGSDPLYERFYVPVPLAGGDEPSDGAQVFKIYTEGVSGDELLIAASRSGVSTSPGYSNVGSYGTELPVFLERPAQYSVISPVPSVSAPSVDYDLACQQVVPGYGGVRLAFSTSGHGQPVLVCDLSGDGDYDLSGEEDLSLLGEATPADTELYWVGTDALGGALPDSGDLTCAMALLTSPMHALVYGADTAEPGIRLFSSLSSVSSPGLTMRWNDTALESTTATRDGTLPQVAAGPEGVFADDIYSSGVTCTAGSGSDCTSHGWGSSSDDDPAYSGAWVDTWAYDGDYSSGEPFPIALADLEDDRDADDLPSPIEDCILGTSPDNPDTDGDGLTDGEEAGSDWNTPNNHDGDSLINALDDDDDGDGILTETELTDTWDADLSGDVDGDGVSNWHDTDSDDDGIPDGDEPNDADGSGVPDYLEVAGAVIGDSGDPPVDTGEPVTATLDGIFQGGVCQCSAASPAPAGLFTGLLFLVTLFRRRQQ